MDTQRDYQAAREFFDNTLIPYLEQRDATHVTPEELRALVLGFLTASHHPRLKIVELKLVLDGVLVAIELSEGSAPARLQRCTHLPDLLDRFTSEIGETTLNPNEER